MAMQLATKLYASKPELREKGFKVMVTDEDGETVHVAPVGPVGVRFS